MYNPDWSEERIEIFEKCIDYVFLADWNSLTFENLVKQGNATDTLTRDFKDLRHLQIELIKYWAWKDTYRINVELARIKSPFPRLIALLKFSFRNNRYLKFYKRIKECDLPNGGRQIIEDVNQIKENFLVQLLMERGLSYEQAKERIGLIRPVYYGWASAKEDVIHSDIQKSNMLRFLKAFLFPEFFKGKDFTVKDL